MHLLDSNVWLALSLSGHAHHGVAREWLDGVEEPATVLFCRSTQQTFLRLLTHPAVLAPYGNEPLTNAEAWAAYERFLADDRIVCRATEPARLETWWRRLAARRSASPKLWMDAYLAAFAIAGGLRLVTHDTAFRQFEDLELTVLAP